MRAGSLKKGFGFFIICLLNFLSNLTAIKNSNFQKNSYRYILRNYQYYQ